MPVPVEGAWPPFLVDAFVFEHISLSSDPLRVGRALGPCGRGRLAGFCEVKHETWIKALFPPCSRQSTHPRIIVGRGFVQNGPITFSLVLTPLAGTNRS